MQYIKESKKIQLEKFSCNSIFSLSYITGDMMKIYKKIILFYFLFQISLLSQTTRPLLEQIISEVRIDSLNNFLKDLSGENQVNISGVVDTIRGRYAFSSGGELACDYLEEKLFGYGYKVTRQSFSEYGENVIAEKIGDRFPELKYIICAHYDTMPYIEISPGADDNGSGTSAVLEAARILRNYNSDYTMVFALWDEEENGQVGSEYYASKAYQNSEYIKGVINLDMIGYNANDNLSVILTVDESKDLGNEMININQDFNIGLTLNLDIQDNPDGSDELSFHQYGYKAIVLQELMPRSYPYYHQVTDTYDKIDHEYHYKNTQLAIATFTNLIGITGITSVKYQQVSNYFNLRQNYPNPFNPVTTIKFAIPKREHVELSVFNTLGQQIDILVNEELTEGSYEAEFSGSNLSSGIYYYLLRTGNYRDVKKMLLLK